MTTSKVRLPQGVSDRLPERARALAWHNDAIARTFALAGYDHVDTPPFELVDVLEHGLGESVRRSLFRMVDPATGEIVVLRPDFTAQIARMAVARMGERPRPLRLRYKGRVLRALDPLGRGMKSREVFQAGAELIGAGDRWADVEVLVVGVRALEHLEMQLLVDLGHAAIIGSLIDPGSDDQEVQRALAMKDAARLRQIAPALEPLADLHGGREVLDRARTVLAKHGPAVHRAIDELAHVADELARRVPDVRVGFDLGEERGLGYYTGVFFHGYVDNAADAVLMGGRYDGLLGRYGRAEPAVGLGIDVDALARSEGPPARSSGYVFAERSLDRPAMLALAEAKRRDGERAVLVAAELAREYARANGYETVVELNEAGAPTEYAVPRDADR